MKPKNWNLVVSHKGLDYDLDAELEKIAIKHHGELGGSGYDLQMHVRDISLWFESEKKAKNCKIAMKETYKNKIKTKIYFSEDN